MNTRATKDGPFCWESKAARRLIRERLAAEVDAPDVRATALGVYSALAEAASDAGADAFTVSLARLGELAAMNEKTIRRRLHDLKEIGLVQIETTTLRAPSRFTLLSVRSGTGSTRSGTGSERSDFVENSHQVRGIEETEKKGTEELLPGIAGKAGERFRTARKPRPLFDVIADAFGYFGENRAIGKSNAALVNKTLAEIQTVCPTVTPEEIRRRVANLRLRFENTSPAALSKWWGDCANPPAPAGRPAQPSTRRDFN